MILLKKDLSFWQRGHGEIFSFLASHLRHCNMGSPTKFLHHAWSP